MYDFDTERGIYIVVAGAFERRGCFC